MELREVSLGMRVSDADGHYATVRYIGPVAASKAKTDVWVGVEWDDSSRGKHDGSCLDDAGEFHRYFECAFGAGSFVKVHKLVRSVGFLDALHSKYKDTSDAKDTTENYALTAKGNQKAIEFVGEENIRKWQQLNLIRQVTLPLMRISHAGEGITPIAGHFTYVDVQRNLISSWVEVGKISSQIPSLQSLSILGNRMEPLTADIVRALPEDCFAHITTFIISKCKIHSWSAMDLLEPLLPVVEELFATHSRFEDLPMYDPASRLGGVTGFRCVKRLDVSASGISEWAQILSFGGLPALQELLADDNPLTRTGPCPEGSFAALTRLSLSAILYPPSPAPAPSFMLTFVQDRAVGGRGLPLDLPRTAEPAFDRCAFPSGQGHLREQVSHHRARGEHQLPQRLCDHCQGESHCGEHLRATMSARLRRARRGRGR